MSIFASVTPSPKPKSKDVTVIATFFAGVLTVMAVAQLFTFESFLELVGSLGLPGGEAGVYLFTSLIVVFEILALPFLLRMQLSPLFRWVSMGSGWLVALGWIILSLWIVVRGIAVETVGFFGTALDLMPGWWAVFISLALGIMAVWASWGMWPNGRKK